MTLMKATKGTDADFSMAGRIAFVTGGTRGIGAAIARRFIASGGRVAVTHLPGEAGAAEGRTLAGELGADKLLAIAADTTDSDAMARAAAETERVFGAPIDTLVINAADISKAPWDEIGIEGWDRMMAVNLRGAYIAALHVAPQMRRKGYGKIITIGSVMANIGDPRALHYVTSKEGLLGFARSLARAEGKSGIRVNCVAPGAIATERHFQEGGKLELGEHLAGLQSVQRRGFADDIAAACQFLASAAGDFISGQLLTVDGGWSNP
jgi:3-oxoacyl-[acyl-carrier protein] reductase